MKTKLSLLLLILALSPVPYALSQIPQGINYQAIARDGAGAILDNKTFNIELTVQTSTGTEIWKELKLVTSNQFGLVTTVLGTGTNIVLGGVASFSMVDWNAQPLYLKTRVQYPGTTWNVMGTSQLWSVPYSLVAKDLEGPVSKLGIEGTTTNAEESLFEVKNKNGEIVFAVYNEGVRVYVPDGAKGPKGGFAVSGWGYNKTLPENYLFVSPDSIRAYIWDDPLEKGAKGGFTVSGFNSAKSITNQFLGVSPDSVRIYIDKASSTKGAKGGFTVSGFGTAKGEEEEYLRVTRDSTRIYINDKLTPKGAKGGFAVSGFANSKAGGGNTNFLNVEASTDYTVSPGEPRILWYPLKNAFLTGKVLVESPDSVGENSFSSGYESKAIGDFSQALGYSARAIGDYSTAIGKFAKASVNSYALGNSAKATGNDSYAFGSASKASGLRSFAFGSVGLDSLGNPTSQQTLASGDYSMALGLGAQSLTLGSISMGVSSKASGIQSVAVGFESKSLDKFSTAVGYRSEANGYGALSIGSQINTSVSAGPPTYSMYLLTSKNIASGSFSTAVGSGNYSSGGGITLGIANTATAYGAFAAGFFNKALGQKSTVLGYYNEATGDLSTVLGTRNTSQSYASLAIGQWSKLEGSTTSWVDTDPLFVAGNGKVVFSGSWTIQRSNAMTLYKNGDLKIAGNFTMGGKSMYGHKLYIDSLYFTPANGVGSMIRGIPLISLKERNYSGFPVVPYSKEFKILVSGKSFTISDEISSRMVIDNNGKVGIGTNTPLYAIHSIGDIYANGGWLRVSGNQGLYFESWGGGWYMLDNDWIRAYNNKNIYTPGIIRTDGTLQVGSGTTLNVVSGGNFAYASNVLFANTTGYVGLGTTSPVYKLHVTQAADGYVASFTNTGASAARQGIIIHAGAISTAGADFISFQHTTKTGTVEIGSVQQTGASTIAYNTTSDARIKEDVKETHYGIQDLLNVRVRDFKFIDDYFHNQNTGFIAQELYEIYPGAVSKPEDPANLWQIDYGKVTPLIVKAVQDQQQIIQSQQQQIESQQKQIDELKYMVQQLMQK